MEAHFDYGKVMSYGRLAKALLRKAAGVEQRGHEFDLARALESVGLGDRTQDRAFQDERSQELIRERKKIAPYKIDELHELPAGSFGHEYAAFMKAHHRTPKFFEETELKDDTSFLSMRMAQTQDMWQVLTGFDESAEGKAGFNAFLLAQTGESLPAVTLGTALLRSALASPAEAKKVVNEISRGWLMGHKAEPLFGIDWEQHWVTPISEMRRRYLHFDQLEEAKEILEEEGSKQERKRRAQQLDA